MEQTLGLPIPPPAVPFGVNLDSHGDVAVVSVVGELDMHTSPILDSQLTEVAGHETTSVIVDIRGVTFLDSSAIHTLVSAKEEAARNEKKLLLIGVQPAARRLFALTRTLDLLDGADSATVLNRFNQEDDFAAEMHEDHQEESKRA